MDSYLQMMYDRLALMRELLADDGSIYVHLDWRVDSYIRAILDEVFGKDNLVNEIVWKKYSGVKNYSRRRYTTQTDTIFLYAKTDRYTFNSQFREMTEKYIEDEYKFVDEEGMACLGAEGISKQPSTRKNISMKLWEPRLLRCGMKVLLLILHHPKG